jgi:enamine deaminase RidA (YjgF/YER057c/UK114 family)
MIGAMSGRSRVRLRIPFSELWSMRIEHPYSLLVRTDHLAWTCGQCPLAHDGAVLAPDDLGRQADYVDDYIQRLLGKAELSRAHVGKLVLYHAPADPADIDRLLTRFRMAFPGAVLVPVGIPYFYYPGMRLEVDVHAAQRRAPLAALRHDAHGFRLQAVDAGELIWVGLEVLRDPDRTPSRHFDSLNTDAVRDALRAAPVGVSSSGLLADHWFVAGDGAWPALRCLREAGVVTDPGAAVRATLPEDIVAMGELTLAPDSGVGPSLVTLPHPGVSTFARSSRTHFWISTRSVFPDLSVVSETQAIMASIEQAMRERGWRFDAVCKATTHYVGRCAAEDLHDNMQVRNAYYQRPGPASTGLPVAAFPFSSSRIAVDVLGVIG